MSDPLHKHGRFFDAWSNFYRLTPVGMWLRNIQRVAIDRLGVRPLEKVLDLGCGPGDGLRAIASRGGFAFGLDYSPGMLAKAQGALGGRGHLARGDAARLPYVDGAFDKVVCTNSFHHYPDQAAALTEIHRVLRPGGLFVLVDPVADSLASRVAVELFEKRVFGLSDVRIHKVSAWKALLTEAGFTTADVRPGPLWRPGASAEVFVEATR